MDKNSDKTSPPFQALSLKFCSKGFSSSSPHTREIFSTLVEHLMFQFNSRKSVIPKIQNGLDVQGQEITRVIQAVATFCIVHSIIQSTLNYPTVLELFKNSDYSLHDVISLFHYFAKFRHSSIMRLFCNSCCFI